MAAGRDDAVRQHVEAKLNALALGKFDLEAVSRHSLGTPPVEHRHQGSHPNVWKRLRRRSRCCRRRPRRPYRQVPERCRPRFAIRIRSSASQTPSASSPESRASEPRPCRTQLGVYRTRLPTRPPLTSVPTATPVQIRRPTGGPARLPKRPHRSASGTGQMPYVLRPPANSSRSNTVTAWPRMARSRAADKPAQFLIFALYRSFAPTPGWR